MNDDTEALRAQLAELDDELARVRADRDGLLEQVGSGAGAQDSEDVAAALTNREESEALLEALERRRESLQQKLEGAS